MAANKGKGNQVGLTGRQVYQCYSRSRNGSYRDAIIDREGLRAFAGFGQTPFKGHR